MPSSPRSSRAAARAARRASSSAGEVGAGAVGGSAAPLRLLPLLLAAEGGEVEEGVRPAGHLQATRVLRVGVEDLAVDLQEAAPTGHLHAPGGAACDIAAGHGLRVGAEVVRALGVLGMHRDREVVV